MCDRCWDDYLDSKNTSNQEYRPRYPLPWKIEREGNTASVRDATGILIPILTDIDLGWQDADTAPYVAPEQDFKLLKDIVDAVNARF